MNQFEHVLIQPQKYNVLVLSWLTNRIIYHTPICLSRSNSEERPPIEEEKSNLSENIRRVSSHEDFSRTRHRNSDHGQVSSSSYVKIRLRLSKMFSFQEKSKGPFKKVLNWFLTLQK